MESENEIDSGEVAGSSPVLCSPEIYPECSGDPTCCPENEGYGCGKKCPPKTKVQNLDKWGNPAKAM